MLVQWYAADGYPEFGFHWGCYSYLLGLPTTLFLLLASFRGFITNFVTAWTVRTVRTVFFRAILIRLAQILALEFEAPEAPQNQCIQPDFKQVLTRTGKTHV